MTIIDSSGAAYIVSIDPDPGLGHAYIGTPAKLVKGVYVAKAGAIPRLIRRAGCRAA